MSRISLRITKTTIIYLLISLSITILSGLLSVWWQHTYWVDLNPPLCASRLLLSGKDPYSSCYTNYGNLPSAPYPMTTIVALIPFSILPGSYLGTASIWGVMNGLLVYGLLKNGKPWLFLLFLSAPYWIAFTYHQLSLLIAAVMLLPSLLPLALVKPQIGIPVIVNNLTIRRFILIILFIMVTFVIYPNWFGEWFTNARNYDGVIPLLLFPLNLFFFLAFFRLRDPSVRLLLMMACVPQRSIYDLVPLFLLPKTLRQMLIACFLSWIAFVPFLTSRSWVIPSKQVWMSLAFIYIPILFMLFFHSSSYYGKFAYFVGFVKNWFQNIFSSER